MYCGRSGENTICIKASNSSLSGFPVLWAEAPSKSWRESTSRKMERALILLVMGLVESMRLERFSSGVMPVWIEDMIYFFLGLFVKSRKKKPLFTFIETSSDAPPDPSNS